MPKSEFKKLSWKQLSEILIKKFWFQKRGQKWSHLKLKKWSFSTIIPQHREIKYWTFKSVLEFANLTEKEFYSNIK